MTLQLMMLYYKTKSGCKRTSSLEDIAAIVIVPRCDLDIEDSETFLLLFCFLFDTLPHDNTPPYKVWLKTVEWIRRYRSDKIGHTDRMTDTQTDRRTEWFQYNPPSFPYLYGRMGGGVLEKDAAKAALPPYGDLLIQVYGKGLQINSHKMACRCQRVREPKTARGISSLLAALLTDI